MKPKINLNPKSNLQWKTQQLRTQNQTFNKNPSTQIQIKVIVTTAMESLLLLCSWRACCCHERGEEQVLESYGKGKDQKKKKKKKRKDCGRGSRENM